MPVAVPDLGIVYDDDDIVVVDKPSGVAAHPSVGWEGPTVLGALAAGGFRVATTGAAERQGIVHRLDVGTSGLMVVAKTERAYTALKRAFKEREVEKIYHAVVQGHPDPLAGTIDAPIGRHPVALVEVRGHARRQGLGHPLRDARGVPAAPRCWRSTSRPGARTRSACTWPRTGIRASAIRSTAATRRCRRAARPDAAVAARAQLSFAHPATGDRVTFTSRVPRRPRARARGAAGRLSTLGGVSSRSRRMPLHFTTTPVRRGIMNDITFAASRLAAHRADELAARRTSSAARSPSAPLSACCRRCASTRASGSRACASRACAARRPSGRAV